MTHGVHLIKGYAASDVNCDELCQYLAARSKRWRALDGLMKTIIRLTTSCPLAIAPMCVIRMINRTRPLAPHASQLKRPRCTGSAGERTARRLNLTLKLLNFTPKSFFNIIILKNNLYILIYLQFY